MARTVVRNGGGNDRGAAETASLLRLYRSLSERARAGLRSCMDILDRELRALKRGDASSVGELAQREASVTRELHGIGKVLARLEPELLGLSGDAARAVLEERELREGLRREVLARNRRNRDALSVELGETRRRIVLRRTRLGTPSPFASIGDASLVDIRT